MNQQILKGHWNEIKGKIKQQWGDLTDDEITRVQGNYQELQGILQKKYGYEKDKAEKEIDKFLETQGYGEEE